MCMMMIFSWQCPVPLILYCSNVHLQQERYFPRQSGSGIEGSLALRMNQLCLSLKRGKTHCKIERKHGVRCSKQASLMKNDRTQCNQTSRYLRTSSSHLLGTQSTDFLIIIHSFLKCFTSFRNPQILRPYAYSKIYLAGPTPAPLSQTTVHLHLILLEAAHLNLSY